MKRICALILAGMLCLQLVGCGKWMDGSYYSVKPHQEDDIVQNQEAVEVSGYTQLYQSLCNTAAAGRQESVFYVSGMEESQLKSYMSIAINSLLSMDPIGAYAVDTVTYELGTNAGRTAVAVQIAYNHPRSEILRIKHVATMDVAYEEVMDALENCDPSVVMLVESYRKTDFVQLVQDFVDQNPDVCMEMPQVSAAVYPEDGSQRVIELSFAYQTSRETLREMQNYVEPVFRAASLNVSADEGDITKFSRMYSFLMERNEYQLETSITPSYSLLRHGVGDSKAFATVYAAMCRQAELECLVVTGTRDGEPWVWNMICTDGVYYHVDLLRTQSVGRLQRLTEEDMRGYVWDYTAYPETGPAYQEEQTQPTEDVSAEETLPSDTPTVPSGA